VRARLIDHDVGNRKEMEWKGEWEREGIDRNEKFVFQGLLIAASVCG